MANKAIDKSYLLQTLKDFNTKILLLFFQKKLTVTTVPSDPENGDVIIYVGSTSGNFIQGHTYKYSTLQTSWVDITATGSYSTGDALALNIDGVDTLPFYDSSALSTKRITWLNIISIIKSAFGTAAEKNVPTSGDASSTEVVLGNDTRLTDSRTPISHTHTKSEITDFPTITDTKNTAGSTDTSDKIYLVGAKSQGANPQTYSDNEVFAQNGVLSSKKLSPKCITALTGTGTAGQDKGSGSTNRYVPALWTFNSGITVADGEVYFIKIPVAGGTYGVWLSLNNGTNYYPVAISNAKARFQTQSPVNSVIAVSYESTGVCNCYARGGADSLVDVTGCFRMVDSYDSNTTYSVMSASELTTGTVTTSRVVRSDYLKSGINSLIDTKINALDVTGASNIAASKTIKAWSETDGKVSVTTQDIAIAASQVSGLATVATTGSYNDLSNKPTIPAAQIQSDWNQTSTTAKDFIKNKPTIPAAQIQSDWNQTTTTAKDYIKNKPTVDTVPHKNSSNLIDSGGVFSHVTHYVQRSHVNALAGSKITIPETSTNAFITSTSIVIPVCGDSGNGIPVKYSKIEVYDGYVDITIAENVVDQEMGLIILPKFVNTT